MIPGLRVAIALKCDPGLPIGTPQELLEAPDVFLEALKVRYRRSPESELGAPMAQRLRSPFTPPATQPASLPALRS